jgi:hypothetical protein
MHRLTIAGMTVLLTVAGCADAARCHARHAGCAAIEPRAAQIIGAVLAARVAGSVRGTRPAG